jgi:hypothetical protein
MKSGLRFSGGSKLINKLKLQRRRVFGLFPKIIMIRIIYRKTINNV